MWSLQVPAKRRHVRDNYRVSLVKEKTIVLTFGVLKMSKHLRQNVCCTGMSVPRAV